jgi:hypothetical protein
VIPILLFFEELCEHHVSGQLKVAPEHVAPKVLEKMGKPGREVYLAFKKRYKEINQRLEKDQYLVPYFMSSHPGSDLEAAVELASFIRKHEHLPEQVQDFYPTPGTLSTCMYYTGLDPRTMEPVYVPRSAHEKAMQRALIQYRNPKLYRLVFEALNKVGRKDLIGYGRNCLIRPPGGKKAKKPARMKTGAGVGHRKKADKKQRERSDNKLMKFNYRQTNNPQNYLTLRCSFYRPFCDRQRYCLFDQRQPGSEPLGCFAHRPG